MTLQDLENYLADRKREEQYPDIETYANAYLGLPVKDNNNNEGVKRRRRNRRI